MSSARRRGWCPGALRPMQTGDGLLVRVKITGGTLSAALARDLAQCAAAYGNGLIDLSSRGNLQFRGVTDARLPALQARLAGLGLIDTDPAAEAVRNIMSSPLAGLDPSALVDIRLLVRALDARLESDHALHSLPGKFLFLIDDGSAMPLPYDKADIAFVAALREQRTCFDIYLGGQFAGHCAADAICDVAARAACAFLRLRSESDDRMAALVARIGVEQMARAADVAAAPEAQSDPRAPSPVLGLHMLGWNAGLGLGVAFGRLDVIALRMLADEAAAIDGTLHLSPWRAIFIVAKHIGLDLVERMRAASFLLDDDAPLRAVAACAGKPACLHGEMPSQKDGAHLAPLAKSLATPDLALHISGCAKGCAHSNASPVTLVGRDGAYDVVIDGCAGDEPLLRGLDLPAVERLMQGLASVSPAERAAVAREYLCEAAR